MAFMIILYYSMKCINTAFLKMKKPSHDALNFVRSKDGDHDSLMLAACLTALGIPFPNARRFPCPATPNLW